MSDPESIALEQLHVGPRDEFDHLMTAFCPCGPELVVGTGQSNDPDDDDEPVEVVTYQHQHMVVP